jgi:RNA polymerase sigma-70 factor (ECF subfamily)
METASSKQLDLCIRNIAKDDEQSRTCLKELYQIMKNPIFKFVKAIAKDAYLAEDALQETFISIMASAKNYKAGTNAKAWIFSIARNVTVDIIKKRSKISFIGDDVLESIPDTYYAYGNTGDSVEALDILKPDEREIVSLHVYAGLRQTEIAKALHLPYITVRSKYGYAMKKLKGYYTKNTPQTAFKKADAAT